MVKHSPVLTSLDPAMPDAEMPLYTAFQQNRPAEVTHALGDTTVAGKAEPVTATGEPMVVAVESHVALVVLLALHRLNCTVPPGVLEPPAREMSAESVTCSKPQA